MSDLSAAIQTKFPQKKVVIVGDLVADQFLRGTIARVSREAPVFILRHDETETLAGSAANAAVNAATLGGKAVLIGVVGEDANGSALLEKLRESNVDCRLIVACEKFQTTTKLRVLAGQHYAARQQVIRIDYENKNTLAEDLRNKLQENFLAAVTDADVVIISDYSYGVASRELTETIMKAAAEKNIPVLVDSRFRLEDFPNVTSATPNQDEVEQILGKNFSDDDCVKLCEKLNYKSLLVTRGNLGMLLVEKDKKPLFLEAVGAKEPVDVTGAGDTVIAAFSLALASGLSFAESAKLANHAGGIVVMKKGTAAVSAEELVDSLKRTQITESKSQTP
ncbi:MAG: bifunctional heptose 7-phosphate kinase/heptose 1-phosphate adenyltransferase [Pyrinomonadaceae bacterium]